MDIYKLFRVNVDLKLIKTCVISLVIFFLTGLDTSTSAATPEQIAGVPQVQQKESTLPSDVNNYIEKSLLINEVQNNSIVGTWRSRIRKNGMSCNQEAVFESNNTYSAVSECSDGKKGKYTARVSGTYRIIRDGVIRLQYNDYSPKEYNGKKIRLPSGETWSYVVINRNQVKFAGVIATRVR